MLTNVSKSDFSSALNSEFVTKSAANVFSAELVSVDEGRVGPAFESFSLVFKAPVETACEQTTYDLAHPKLGNFELFMVPLKRNAEGVFFEAVVNRAII